MANYAHTPFTTSGLCADVLNHGVSNIFHFDKERWFHFPLLTLWLIVPRGWQQGNMLFFISVLSL